MLNVCPNCGTVIVNSAQDKSGLTRSQMKVLESIKDLLEENKGAAPSFRQIASHVGTTASNAHGICMRLVDRGYLRHVPGQKNSLMLV